VFATNSRGGALALVLAMGLVGVLALRYSGSSLVGRRRRTRILLAFVGALLVFVGLVLIPGTGVRQSVTTMVEFTREQSAQQGLPIYLSGRENVLGGVRDFLESPVIGLMPGQPEHTNIMVHNVFIMIAKAFGLVGLLTYLVYFFGPTLRVCYVHGLARTWPFLVFITALALSLSSLPFPNYKVMHVFNGMMLVVLFRTRTVRKGGEEPGQVERGDPYPHPGRGPAP
jgi:hypothetical protein